MYAFDKFSAAELVKAKDLTMIEMDFLVFTGKLLPIPPFIRGFTDKSLIVKPLYILENRKPPTKYNFYGTEDNFIPASLSENNKINTDITQKMPQKLKELALYLTTNAVSNLEKAKLIESYFHQNYTYSLEVHFSEDKDPLIDFIFNKKIGFCTHFASSMVLLLRSAGVASNVINGYLVDEYDNFTESYIVREKDAHAWVEVFDEKKNVWVGFDPTPVSLMNEYLDVKPSIIDKFLLYTKFLSRKLRDLMKDFSFNDLKDILNSKYTYILITLVGLIILLRNVNLNSENKSKKKRKKIDSKNVKDLYKILKKYKVDFPHSMTYGELKEQIETSELDLNTRNELGELINSPGKTKVFRKNFR